jgi:hypothetical protein
MRNIIHRFDPSNREILFFASHGVWLITGARVNVELASGVEVGVIPCVFVIVGVLLAVGVIEGVSVGVSNRPLFTGPR